MHQVSFGCYFCIFIILCVSFSNVKAQNSPLKFPSGGKTRLRHSNARISSDQLVSIKLATKNINEFESGILDNPNSSLKTRNSFCLPFYHRARQILLRHQLELVSREGSLENWYLAKHKPQPGTEKVRFLDCPAMAMPTHF
jgi:hypothetical protein